MGSVWLVRRLDNNAERALKLIANELASDPQVRARFKREARVMARLSHPNAVAVYDSMLAKDAAFIEMECIHGQSLNRFLKGRSVPAEWAANFLDQLCDVLQTAHDLDIVHRDLKPSNLMLVENSPAGKERLKVLDFGIAKILAHEGNEEEDDVKTQANTFLGSSHYSSPEQIRGTEIDARADLYATGVILYEMLTGQRPFTGSAAALIQGHMMSPPPPFAAKNPRNDVPPEVEAVVLRCLAKKPEDRSQSARVLRDEFQQALKAASNRPKAPHRPVYVVPPRPESRPEPPPIQPVARPAEPPREVLPTPIAISRSSKRAGVAAALIGLVAITIGIVAWKNRARFAAVAASEKTTNPTQGDGSKTATGVPNLYSPSAEARRHISEWARVGIKPIVSSGTEHGWPKQLARTDAATGVKLAYQLSKTGHYLPSGYSPSGTALAADNWPSVLSRDKDGARFLRLVGDQFTMGCIDGGCGGPDDPAYPSHKVVLTGYYLQETEVTNDEWARFLASPKSESREEAPKVDPKLATHPVLGVSHRDAERFAATHANGLLPTEAQWEFAARSRSSDKNLYPWSWRPADEQAQLKDKLLSQLGNINRPPDSGPLTRSVGGFKGTDATEQGVLDLAGNVREWCRDVYAAYPEDEAGRPAPMNPEGPKRSPDGSEPYVIRGGSFASTDHTSVQTTHRGSAKFAEKPRDVGLRVVLETPDSPGSSIDRP
ncbi:MAG: serine/threonine protein kinase [Planctomycetota bacterium]|nr:serine/threonine protein kinase [Planctomycetota bacterium]